ncbi:MAG: hypothetical protein ACM3ZT_00895 [Bacillota bacterium]
MVAKSKLVPVALLISIALTGCSVAFPMVHIDSPPLPSNDRTTFIDKRIIDNPPAFLAGEGNIYSCHYGIRRVDDNAFDPPRMVLLHAYLANQILTDSQPHIATLYRFEIYWNGHLIAERGGTAAATAGLAGMSGAGGGTRTAALAVAAGSGPSVQPGALPGDTLVGCENSQQGEYYYREAPDPDSRPIVTYIDIDVDGKDYKIRHLHPMVPEDKIYKSWPVEVKTALDESFSALGDEIKPSVQH